MRMRMRMQAYSMTKVISLSDKAYSKLKGQKRQGESFSDVVLRLSGENRGESILRFSGAWKGDDIGQVFAVVAEDRERSESRRIAI